MGCRLVALLVAAVVLGSPVAARAADCNYQGAAGSSYVGISTVLIATHSDGSQQIFAGCYTARASNVQPDGWHLFGAAITPAPNSPPIAPLLARDCG